MHAYATTDTKNLIQIDLLASKLRVFYVSLSEKCQLAHVVVVSGLVTNIGVKSVVLPNVKHMALVDTNSKILCERLSHIYYYYF